MSPDLVSLNASYGQWEIHSVARVRSGWKATFKGRRRQVSAIRNTPSAAIHEATLQIRDKYPHSVDAEELMYHFRYCNRYPIDFPQNSDIEFWRKGNEEDGYWWKATSAAFYSEGLGETQAEAFNQVTEDIRDRIINGHIDTVPNPRPSAFRRWLWKLTGINAYGSLEREIRENWW